MSGSEDSRERGREVRKSVIQLDKKMDPSATQTLPNPSSYTGTERGDVWSSNKTSIYTKLRSRSLSRTTYLR